MRAKLVVGNWKLNGSLSGNAALLKALAPGVQRVADRQCVVCVPTPYLTQVGTLLAGAIPAAALALLVQGAFEVGERRFRWMARARART